VPCVFGLGRDSSLLFWSWALWGFGQGLWSYLWPIYLARLGADSFQVGLVVGVPFLFATLCYVPGGFFAQLGHHKWQLAGAHVLPILTTGSFALAGTWWHVLPGVILASLVALSVPAIHSYIARVADDEGVSVPRIFTMIGASLFAGMMLSPPLGGWIADRAGTTAAVFPLVSLSYACSVFLMCLLRSRPLQGSDRATGESEAAIGHHADQGAGAGRRGALAAGTGAYRDLLRTGAVRLLLLTALLVHFGIHLGISFVPLYLGEIHGYDRAQIGWAGSAASLGTVMLLLTLDRFRRQHGPVASMCASCGAVGAHFGLALVSPATGVQAVGFFFRGGVQAAATLITVALTEAVPRSLLAPATALLATVAGFAAMAAPPVGGWLYARAPAAPFVAGIVLLTVAVPLISRAFRPSSNPASRPTA
jgi:MFS family permease